MPDDEFYIREKIRSVIRSIPALTQFQFHDFEFLYDSDEQILHVVFNPEQDADDSVFLEEFGEADGNVLVHTANGIVVGFSILDTQIGRPNPKL
ncbi:MAG: hypothetical protein D0433_07105 [Candidatus Thermochlorobacter aerophilum]|jgi:hypothetical protein|uniref:DUF2283 domain-containing protein n=1 Tax=Candidatus Thermochlorobacter aerophilus TaxID=1868324 RepID=A0A395M1Y8_9BACT|nr:MAG: hypothetical protein D0433_07105 [Candidatus Thermochlorobacter aerophilum]